MNFVNKSISEYFRKNMVTFMCVGIKTFERISALVALFAEKEIVTVFAHPAFFNNNYLTVETFIYFLLIKLGLKHDLEFMICSVSFRGNHIFVTRPFKEALLAQLEVLTGGAAHTHTYDGTLVARIALVFVYGKAKTKYRYL